jgi:hypothetical protein
VITFIGGPATARQGMLLRRAPDYLRIVVDADGGVDALDQLVDTPQDGELVHVYRRRGGVDAAHLCYRGKQKHRSGYYAIAEYEYLADVDGEQLRDTDAWRAWAQAQPPSMAAAT